MPVLFVCKLCASHGIYAARGAFVEIGFGVCANGEKIAGYVRGYRAELAWLTEAHGKRTGYIRTLL